MRIVLRGGTLFDGTGAPARPATVIISHQRIEAVLEPGQPEPDGQVIDCTGKFVLPGLIDTHVHLAFAAGPDHETTRRILAGDDDATLLLRQVRHAQQCLLTGITTVRDCGGRDLSSFALRDAIAAGILPGPRIVASGMPITTTAGHLHFCGYRADSADEVRRAARMLIEKGADFIKVMATGGNMTPGSNPCRPQYSQEELTALADDAHRLGRQVAAHVGAAEGIRRCLEARVDTLEHGNWLNPDGTLGYDPRLAERMAEQGTYLGLAVPGIDRLNLLPDTHPSQAARDRALEALRAKYEPFRRMWAAGVSIMVSSDAGVRLTPFTDIHLSLETFSFALDVSPAEALTAVTATPARALKLDHEIGTIEAGKRADVLVVEGDPLADLKALARVRLVLRDGAIAVEGDRLSMAAATGQMERN